MATRPTKAQQKVIDLYFDHYKLKKIHFGGKTEFWMERARVPVIKVRRDVAERCIKYGFVRLNQFCYE